MRKGWRGIIIKACVIAGLPAIVTVLYYKRLVIFYASDPVLINKLDHFYTSPGKPAYIFMGSSRMLHYVDPRIIDSVCKTTSYNLGIDGLRITEMRMLLRICIEVHKIPRMLILNVDPSSFDTKTPVWSFTDLLSYARRDTVVYDAMAGVQDVYACKWKYPFYRLQNLMSVNDGFKVDALYESEEKMRRQLAAVNEQDQCVVLPDGFSPCYFPYKESYFSGFNEKYQQKGFDLLRDVIALCRQKGIQIVLVTTPMYKDYRNVFLNAGYLLSRVKMAADSMGVPYYNMIDDSLFSGKENFYNFVHLNGLGAEKFSYQLADILHRIDSARDQKTP